MRARLPLYAYALGRKNVRFFLLFVRLNRGGGVVQMKSRGRNWIKSVREGEKKKNENQKKSLEVYLRSRFPIRRPARAFTAVTRKTRGNYKFPHSAPCANIESARSNGKCFSYARDVYVRTIFVFTPTTIFGVFAFSGTPPFQIGQTRAHVHQETRIRQPSSGRRTIVDGRIKWVFPQ